MVTQLDEHTVEIVLSPALRLTLRVSKNDADLSIDVASEGSLRDQIDALDFFIAAGDGQAVVIDEHSYSPSSVPNAAPAELINQRRRLGEIAHVLDKLHIDRSLLDLSKVDDSQRRILSALYQALLRGAELYATDGAPGRFDLELGDFSATLMALPGNDHKHWRFIDVFDPANRTQFRLFTSDDEGQLKEIQGTAYEGLNAEQLATALNLRLDSVGSAYEAVSDKTVAYALANHKVLHLIGAADRPETPQREQLLSAAQDLNEWLIRYQGEESTHLINRWQIHARLDSLTETAKDEIRSLRRAALRANVDNADAVEACCAILLGDQADIRHVIGGLTPELRQQLGGWPIWTLTGLPAVTATAAGDVEGPSRADIA